LAPEVENSEDGAVFIQEREESVVDFNVRHGDTENSMKPRPAPAKRQVHAKQGPGRPRRKPRQEDWNQQWIDVVEGKYCTLVRAWDSYDLLC